jgi:hypothetical protein
VSAVIVGRGRVTLAGRNLPAPEVLTGAGAEFAPGELEELLRQAVAAKRITGRVAIGIEPSLEFFSTERRDPMGDGNQQSMLDALVNELGSDKIGRELATSLPEELFSTAMIVPAGLAREARRGLTKLGATNVRLISTTHALHRLSAMTFARRKHTPLEIRILAANGAGIALLCQKGEPLARHVFEYSQAHDHAIVSAARRLMVVARESIKLEGVPLVVLHVGEEAPIAGIVKQELGVEVVAASALDLGPALVGIALAQAAFRRGAHVNLLQAASKAIGTEPAEFPLAGVAGVSAALLALALWLNGRSTALETRADNVDAENAEIFEHFGTDLYELREQEQRHAFAAHLLGAFVKDRARWATLLMELPRVLPQEAKVLRFEGQYAFSFSAEDPSAPPPVEELESKRWCELVAAAPIAVGGWPPQAGQLGAALQDSPVFQNPFRNVEGPQVDIITQGGDPHARVRIRMLTR